MELLILAGLVGASQIFESQKKREVVETVGSIFRIYYPTELNARQAREAYTWADAKRIAEEFPYCTIVDNSGEKYFIGGQIAPMDLYSLAVSPRMEVFSTYWDQP